ncbi:GNAT family N-acetyltransferase [Streptomyces sp. NBC_01210]|uniref:GNAT family N-acetyltransferase n=1 Tax=Streptomyces sp. NBC_01210 TaxID=2903774 RepID=UPI002E12720E|nr:GNAT family N-acetyltransferase [Streptomyces sp. NBC_01210]
MAGERTVISVRLCRDPRDFAGLRPEWEALQRRCATATPFQSHAWLLSWWLSYGRGGRLRVVLVRRGGRLVAAAPLMLVHRPMPLLVPMGGQISDFGDILVDDEHAEIAITGLERGLHRAARHAVIELREVRPGAAAQRLYEAWTGARRRLTDSVCLELPAVPVEELVKRLPTVRAQRLQAELREIDALKIESYAVPEHEVPAAVDHLLRLHELQWRGRGVAQEHLKPRFAEHLARATQRMVRAGEAALTEFRLDGEVVAAHVALQSGYLTGGYLHGAHPGLREKKVDVATMLLRHDAELAARTGRQVLSLLRGDEAYKSHWRPRAVINQRLLLARSGLEPALRLRAAQAGRRARAAGGVDTRFRGARWWRARLDDWRDARAADVRGGGGAPRP